MGQNVDKLVEDNIGLVRQVARKRFAARLPDDDLEQCGLIGLWEAAKDWNGKGEFAPLARTAIYHNMLDHVRSQGAKRNTQGEELREDDKTLEDNYCNLDQQELFSEFERVLGAGSLPCFILCQIVLNAQIQPVARFLGLEVCEVRKVARRAWRAVKRARETIEQE